ncbi:MAG: hypothetical protein WKG32_08370 [Gemmatimonadaceae bacterium]
MVVSQARGLSRNRAEYQVVPLYLPSELLGVHSASDFLLRPSETTLGVAYLAALWNTRPLLAKDLFQERARIVTPAALEDLRDAHLHLADPTIAVGLGRLGTSALTDDIRRWRAQEIAAWQPLSGRALAPAIGAGAWVKFLVNTDWLEFSEKDLERFSSFWKASDDLVNRVVRPALGDGRALFDVTMSFGRFSSVAVDTFFSGHPRHDSFTIEGVSVAVDKEHTLRTEEFPVVRKIGAAA